MRRFRILAPLSLGFVLLTAGGAGAAPPDAHLTEQLDDVVKVLSDPALRAPGQEGERRATLRRMVVEMFDFAETAKRVLGSHWSERTPEEQARFVRVFTGLVDHAYLRRLDDYGGQRLVVAGQTIQNDEARAQVQVIEKNGDITSLELLMVRFAGDRWRAYDVKIGWMSLLVANYRAQFNKIIRAGSYEELIKRLEAKVGGDVAGASPR